MTRPPRPPRCTATLSLAWLVACGGAPARQDPAAVPAPQALASAAAGSLNRFAAERVMLIPAQGVAAADPLSWRGKAGAEKSLLQRVDSVLEAALVERGLSQWIFIPAVVRSVKRNPTYLIDPYQIRAAGPVRVALRSREPTLLEPLSSQLRGLAGVNDARWALVPVEVTFDAAGGAAGRVRLALAIIDVREAQVRWAGEVTGDPSADYSFATIASAIQRAADLFVPR